MIYCLQNKFRSIADHLMIQLRDVESQNSKLWFRTNLRKLGNLMAYEFSKSLTYKEIEVETQLGISPEHVFSESIVSIAVLRAGLPLHEGVLEFLPEAESGFIASYRQNHKDGTFEIANLYSTFPPLDDKTIILCDTMLATGASILSAIEEIKGQYSPKKIVVFSIISAAQGIARVQRMFPDVDVYSVAIDDELTAKSYIVPGLGDAGDLAYGPKIQD